MQPFFDLQPGCDPTYEALRVPDSPNAVRARAHFDQLWDAAAPFLSSEVVANARSDFHAVFWEVYLAATLRQLGKHLVPRAERTSRSRGPDLLQSGPEIFYEATAVKPGTTADAVVEAVPGGARQVPDVEISLRLTSGLSAKLSKYVGYRKDGTVRPDVPFIIAINAGAVPSAGKELELPRIVRTVFPFGHEVLHFDSTTWRYVGSSYTSRSGLSKHSGETISTRFFDDTQAVGISAILCSCVDAFNWPETGGRDFVLVHNPQATNPAPRGLLPGAVEFWIEGDTLRREQIPSGGS